MRNLNTRSDVAEGSMTMEKATQYTSRQGFQLRPSLRFAWRFASFALAIVMFVSMSDSRRTFASLLSDARVWSELPIAAPLQSPSSRAARTPLAHTSRELELLQSIELGEVAHAQLLLAAGVSANSKDLQGWTPLMMAARHNRLALLPYLFARGAEVNAQNAKGTTALMLAASNGHAEMVQALLTRGAKINARTKDGWSALMYAAWKGRAEITANLLRAGANPAMTDAQQWTACMYAAWQGHTATVEALLTVQRANTQQMAERKQARALADRQGHTAVVRLFDQMEKQG